MKKLQPINLTGLLTSGDLAQSPPLSTKPAGTASGMSKPVATPRTESHKKFTPKVHPKNTLATTQPSTPSSPSK